MLKKKHLPENEFIMEFIKITFGNGSPERLKQFLAKSNQQILNEQIRRHGLAGYFYKYITKNEFPLKIPAQILDAWKQSSAQIALQNTIIEQEGIRIFDYLNKNGIDYILLKGFAYTEELYGSKWIRSIGDLDVLIKKDDYPRLKDYLLEGGFYYKIEPEFQESPDEWMQIQESIRNEMGFWKKVGVFTFYIDVHWEIANLKSENSPLQKMFQLNLDEWFDYQSAFSLGDNKVKCLDLNAHFIHMVYHFAYGHQFAGVKWLLDICRFTVSIGEQLNWSLIRKIVSRTGNRRLFDITRRMVSEIIGVNHPGMENWSQLYSGFINPIDYNYFKNRVFSQRSLSGTYTSFILMPEGFRNKWKMLAFILFNREVSKRWELTGKKINPIIQPFYILYWGISEKLRKIRR